jgi:hypothetical protein
MHRLLMDLDQELRDKGELVASDALVDPTRATTVRFTNGTAVPTDGPFAEIKESLAGYWLIEASHERTVEAPVRGVADAVGFRWTGRRR